MVYLFVDTNIYVGSGYMFTNNFFSKIEKYALDNEVKLLICSICENEVRVHIKNDVEEIIKAVNKKINKGIFGALRNDVSYKNRYLIVDEDEAEKSLISGFETYLEKVKAETFSVDGISVEKLMEDYFHMNPPFEPKKPQEFKDAIMIRALKNYQKLLGEEIHILSNDEGFRTAFQNDENFVVYDYYKKFLQFLSRREEVSCAFEEYCQGDRVVEISEMICEYIEECEFYDYNKPEFEILDTVKINGMEIEFLYCEIIDKENVKIHVWVDADVNVNARYLDEENSCYDHEEKEYIYCSYLDVVQQHSVRLEIVLNGKYTMDDSDEEDLIEKYECVVYSAEREEVDSVIELDETTLIDMISCNEYIPAKDRVWFETNSIYCSECGNRIGFEGDENYFSYKDEPLCDECMEDNEHGFVCPNCSKKYPESMRGSSGMYCMGCEQKLDV